MKRILFSLLLLPAITLGVKAQEPSTPQSNWKFAGVAGINLSQTSLTNWAAGGENSMSWQAYLNYAANYKSDRWSWDNALVADFGKTYTTTAKWQKSIDKLNLTSKIGYFMTDQLTASFMGDFLTQFDKGYKTAGDRETDSYISHLMAPGYLTLATGIDYKPNTDLSVMFAPVTGKLTFVTDEKLSKVGAYGVPPGDHFLGELGASLVANYNKQLTKQLNLISKLTLFSAYNHNFGRVDLLWDILLSARISKYLSATLTLNFVYDDDVHTATGGPKLQVRQILGVGISYTL